MFQNYPRRVLLSVGFYIFSLIFETVILPAPPASAAGEGTTVKDFLAVEPAPKQATAPAPNPSQNKHLSAPILRLMSEIPILRRLVTPPNSSPPPLPLNPTITVNTTGLSFTAQYGGGNPAAQTLRISNTGGGTLTWTASDNASWLALSPASGINSGTVTISPALGSLGVGPHSASITLSAPGASTVSVPVTFTITTAPVPPAIGVNTPSLSFTAQHGGGNPAAQTLHISNTGGGTLTWTASDNASWLALSPASGTNSGTVTISPALGSLGVGPHSASITLSAPGASTVSVPVTFTVTTPPIMITVSPSSLAYAGVSGESNPSRQTVTVTSNGNWTARSDAPWLTLSPTSGSGNGTITAGVALGSASAGSNTATIAVSSGGTTRTVNVTMTLATPSLTLSSNSLTFTATQGAANPPSQTIAVRSNEMWKASDDGGWLSLSQTSGSSNGTITASVNTSSAVQGDNKATITVTSGAITKTATVILTLSAPSNSSATLSWNPNKETDLAGYKVYRSTTSGTYLEPIAILQGNVTTYQAAGLKFGTTYYFVVTAFDIAGNESGYSNEVSKSVF